MIFDKLNGGIQQLVIGEGTHFRIPFIQDPIILDVRSRPRTIHSSTGTKDLQMVSTSHIKELPMCRSFNYLIMF